MTDNFECIYKILKTLEKALDLEEADLSEVNYEKLKISETRWNHYIEMLLEIGYIKNAEIRRFTNGESAFINKGISITLTGLEYLTDNSIMKRLCEKYMKIKNAIL